MRIDAIGLPVDRLQLRPDALRQPTRPVFIPLTPASAARPAARPEAARPTPPPYTGQGAAAAQAAIEASFGQGARAIASPGSLIEQLRKQRLSLGRMLGDVNRRLAEPASQPANS